MNISAMSALLLRSTKNLNTLNGVNHIQWSAGYQAAINNVYFEANRYKDIDNLVSRDSLLLMAQYCSDVQERLGLSGDDRFPFLDGMHSGYQSAKDVINEALK